MLSTVSNFFNTSIAALNVYDILVIVLFILAIVLSIVSGVIIVSARVKKINVELEKSKNIQNINERIIQNRLDLIINKLDDTDIRVKNQHFLSLDNNTNNNIKQAVANSQKEDISSQVPNIIALPSPEAITSNQADNNSSIENKSEPYDNIETTHVINNNNDVEQEIKVVNQVTSDSKNTDNITTNIPISVPLLSENQEEKNTIETITVNTANMPEIDSGANENQEDTIINIKDASSKPYEIEIDTTSNEENSNLDLENESNFDKGQSIPLKTDNQNNKILFDTPNNNDLEGNLSYEDNTEKEADEELEGLNLANKILNDLEVFSDEEKFEITDNITEDGQYINCLVRNKYLNLNYKEISRQLLVQRLVDQYYYPLDSIEVNYSIALQNGLTKKADVIIFDDNNNPYIVSVIATPNKKKRFKLLKKLVKATDALFAIWTDGLSIMYYQYIDNSLEEISDLPEYNENIDINVSNKSNKTQFISQPKVNLSSRKHNNFKPEEFTNAPSFNTSHNNVNFAKDNHNIYRKNSYTLSNDYKAIVAKYNNFNNKSLNQPIRSQINNNAYVGPRMPLNVNRLPINSSGSRFTSPVINANINMPRNNNISKNPVVPYNTIPLNIIGGINMNKPTNFPNNFNMQQHNLPNNNFNSNQNFNNIPAQNINNTMMRPAPIFNTPNLPGRNYIPNINQQQSGVNMNISGQAVVSAPLPPHMKQPFNNTVQTNNTSYGNDRSFHPNIPNNYSDMPRSNPFFNTNQNFNNNHSHVAMPMQNNAMPFFVAPQSSPVNNAHINPGIQHPAMELPNMQQQVQMNGLPNHNPNIEQFAPNINQNLATNSQDNSQQPKINNVVNTKTTTSFRSYNELKNNNFNTPNQDNNLDANNQHLFNANFKIR